MFNKFDFGEKCPKIDPLNLLKKKDYTQKIYNCLKNDGKMILFDKNTLCKEFEIHGILKDFQVIAQKNFVVWQSMDEVKKLESRSNIQIRRKNLKKMLNMKNYHPPENLKEFRTGSTKSKQRRVLWLRKMVFERRGFGKRVKRLKGVKSCPSFLVKNSV